MRFGPKVWQTYTIDSPCVPHGGKYGRVDWFAAECEKIGLMLAWSRRLHCFLVFSRIGRRKYKCQEIYRRPRGPGKAVLVPLTMPVFAQLRYLWNRAHSLCGRSVAAIREYAERARDSEVTRQRAKAMYEMRKEVMDAVSLVRGWRGPRIMVAPARPDLRPIAARAGLSSN